MYYKGIEKFLEYANERQEVEKDFTLRSTNKNKVITTNKKSIGLLNQKLNNYKDDYKVTKEEEEMLKRDQSPIVRMKKAAKEVVGRSSRRGSFEISIIVIFATMTVGIALAMVLLCLR